MNAIQKQMLSTLALAVACVQLVSAAVADPIHGRDVLKFSQKPMDGTVIPASGAIQQYWGHDELSTAYSATTDNGRTPYQGTFMADDFADKFNSPIVHVKWWGSYLNNFQNANIPVNKFLISFESDVPATATNSFSHPGQPILNQIVKRGPLTPGSGTFTEAPISLGGPPLNEGLFEYNAELHLDKSFFEKADTVYWLKIVALVDLPPGIPLPPPNQPPTFAPRWGWHNRDYTIKDTLASTAPLVVPGETQVGSIGPAPGGVPIYHFQDDAVTGNVFVNTQLTPMGEVMPFVEQGGFQPRRYLGLADGPPLIADFSKDLAFELYTVVPEPASCALIAIVLAGVVGIHRGRRTV